jgi:hypothetical protein
MKGWHSVGKVSKPAIWDPAELGTALKAELAKGASGKESMGQVLGGRV